MLAYARKHHWTEYMQGSSTHLWPLKHLHTPAGSYFGVHYLAQRYIDMSPSGIKPIPFTSLAQYLKQACRKHSFNRKQKSFCLRRCLQPCLQAVTSIVFMVVSCCLSDRCWWTLMMRVRPFILKPLMLRTTYTATVTRDPRCAESLDAGFYVWLSPSSAWVPVILSQTAKGLLSVRQPNINQNTPVLASKPLYSFLKLSFYDWLSF